MFTKNTAGRIDKQGGHDADRSPAAAAISAGLLARALGQRGHEVVTMFRFLKSLGSYLLTVLGGTILFIALSPLFNYVAYSDRLGPGFYVRKQPFSFSELLAGLSFAAGYAVLMAPYAAVVGAVCILVIRALEKVKLHRCAVSGIAGMIFFFSTGYLALVMGWYIAAGAPLIIFTAVLGALAGALLIPNPSKRRQRSSTSTSMTS
jgi:hypothetical protein